MNKFLRKIRLQNFSALLIGLLLIVCMYFLSTFLMKNPYQSVHSALLQTVENIHSYYRDSPGYWKLNTESATEASLIAPELLGHKDFDIKVGQGYEGEMSMPYNSTFDITFNNLSKSACIGLSEINIPQESRLSLQKITIINDKTNTAFLWGDKEHALPISKWKTRDLCQSGNNKVMWTFQ